MQKEIKFTERGKVINGEIIGERGDFYIVSHGIQESIVPKHSVIDDKMEQGGTLSNADKLSSDAEFINSLTFYRYYPINDKPFKVSYEKTNTYGDGIYFSDSSDYYKGKFDNARLITMRPNVRHPYFITNHNNKIPSEGYTKLESEFGDGNLNRKLIESGFDSTVVIDLRGIFLIILTDNPDLIDVKSDLGFVDSKSDENDTVYATEVYVADIVNDLIKGGNTDLCYEGGIILFRNYSSEQDINEPFMVGSEDFETCRLLAEKGYIEEDLFNNSPKMKAFKLTNYGKNFVADVLNS